MISFYCDRFSRTDANGNSTSTILHLLAGTKNILTLPELTLKLIKTLNNGQENFSEIADLIRIDPSLTLKVMDMYYTCYHRGANRLINLESALKIIGLDTINTMVSCSSAGSIFDSITNAYKFNLKLFWKHSLKSALLAELISRDIPGQSPDEAFLTGILHDIGKLVLFTSFPNIYSKLSEKTDHSNIISKEQKLLGIDHCYIGSKLIEGWHFYPFMADALLYHHHPLEKVAAALPLVKILYLANLLAEEEIAENNANIESGKILFSLTQDKVEEYIFQAGNKLKEIAATIEIDETTSLQNPTINSTRNDVRSNLAGEVRDRSLIAYALQNVSSAKDKGSVLHIIRQGFQILFEKSNVFFFLYNEDENSLVGHCHQDDDYSAMIKGLRVSMYSESSMLVSCLNNKNPIDSFSQQKNSELTIMDSQLVRFAGNDGILCLPMIEKQKFIGTIVIGVGKAESTFISKQTTLLNSFLHHCAMILSAWNKKEDGPKQQHPQTSSETVLSRKIVHEINNPLSVIKNYLKVLGMKLDSQEIEHDEIRIIDDEINRISKMLRNLAEPVDKASKIVKEPVNLNALLLDIIKLTNGSLGDGAEVTIHLDSDPSIPVIITERDDLKQVFINLIKNAVESMPLGGDIGIKTSYINGTRSGTAGKGAVPANGKIQIVVTDDGPGISDEIKSALFDEFVTSKQGHEGLGLSIVKSIINKLNGSIRCESIMGKGTSFHIELPIGN